MTTNYDPIAEQYKRSKQQPWRAYIEAFTLMRLIDDPTGKKVIDIACGEGFYTRMIRQRGSESHRGRTQNVFMRFSVPGERENRQLIIMNGR